MPFKNSKAKKAKDQRLMAKASGTEFVFFFINNPECPLLLRAPLDGYRAGAQEEDRLQFFSDLKLCPPEVLKHLKPHIGMHSISFKRPYNHFLEKKATTFEKK